MQDLEYMSITNIKHKLVSLLEPSPFYDELKLSFYDNSESGFYPCDSFRRLYNDTVESMRAYQSLARHYMYKSEQYQKESAHFHGIIEDMLNESSSDDSQRIRYLGFIDTEEPGFLPDDD